MDATSASEHAYRLMVMAHTRWLDACEQLQHAIALAPTPQPSGAPEGVNLNIAPNRKLPGMSAFEEMVGGLISYGLIGSLIGVVVAAMILGAGRWFGNPYATSVGRVGIFAALAAGLIIGAAPQLVIWFYNIGKAF
ncbi:DUF6112 family protein [Streptosporangium sandarakinum]|uniref:DUF6112 family protein n=1 Tax=Streptosporangium sandarakinum TaxID=1260955 RepID=UPI0037A04CE8